MYKFLICLHCDFLKQGKGRVNEIEVSETSKCLSFQAFLSACLSHDLFSTLDASFFCIAAGVKYYKKKKENKQLKKQGGQILHQLAMFRVLEMVVILSLSFTPVTPFSRSK